MFSLTFCRHWTGNDTDIFHLEGQATDERKNIVGIPKIFDKLVQGGEDPLVAVKTVVALLAGEPET